MVKVSLSGRKLATFAAEGVGVAVGLELAVGLKQIMASPAGAKVVLGKGAMGVSDLSVAFSPDGTLCWRVQGIGVWLTRRPQPVSCGSASRSNRGVVAGPSGGGIEAGSSCGRWRPASGSARHVAFSPRMGRVLAPGSSMWIRLWDVETLALIATLGRPGITLGTLRWLFAGWDD